MFRLEGWEKAPGVDPSNVARLHFFLYRPKAVKLKIERITLVPKGFGDLEKLIPDPAGRR